MIISISSSAFKRQINSFETTTWHLVIDEPGLAWDSFIRCSIYDSLCLYIHVIVMDVTRFGVDGVWIRFICVYFCVCTSIINESRFESCAGGSKRLIDNYPWTHDQKFRWTHTHAHILTLVNIFIHYRYLSLDASYVRITTPFCNRN